MTGCVLKSMDVIYWSCFSEPERIVLHGSFLENLLLTFYFEDDS